MPLVDVPRKYVASLLTLNFGYVNHIMFQAKADKLYLLLIVLHAPIYLL